MLDLEELKRRRRILLEAMDQQTQVATIMRELRMDPTPALAEAARLAERLVDVQEQIGGHDFD